MADTKISDLTDGAPALAADIIPVARTGTNRRLTVENVRTLAADDLLSFGGTTSAFANERWSTVQTVDTLLVALGTTSRAMVLCEAGDESFDFAHGQQTHPTLFVHSAAQSTTQWVSLAHTGGAGVVGVGTGYLQLNGASGVGIPSNQWFGDDNTAAYARFYFPLTTPTPDSAVLLLGASSNALNIYEVADGGSDMNNGPGGTAALDSPGLIVHSKNASTTQYTALQANAITSRRSKTLTEAGGAENVFQITTVTTQSGGGEIDYKIHVTDGTDYAVRAGKLRFVFLNIGGTVTATISAADETVDDSVLIATAGETLTYQITADVATANVFKLAFNIDSNIASNAAHIDYLVTYNGPGEVVLL